MSLYDYRRGRELDENNEPFYGLIQAAMRKADPANLEALKENWPDVWEELQKRYHAPGGLLPGERG